MELRFKTLIILLFCITINSIGQKNKETFIIAQNDTTVLILQNPVFKIDTIKTLVISKKSNSNSDLMLKLKDIFQLGRDFVTIIGILIAIILSYIAVSNNLKQENIKDLIKKINDKQKEIQEFCYDELNKLSHNEKQFYTSTELDEIYQSACKLDKVSFNSLKEIANISQLLKNSLRYFKEKTKLEQFDNKIIEFYISGLEEILLYTTKKIAFPSLLQIIKFTKSPSIYNKSLNNISNKFTFKMYGFIELGANINSCNLEIIHFYSSVNNIKNLFILKSLFRQIHNSVSPVVRLLYISQIYFPGIIELNEKTFLLDEKLKLLLIGFSFWEEISTSERSSNVKLYYTTERDNVIINIEDFFKFNKETINNYKDSYCSVEFSNIEIKKITNDKENQLLTLEINRILLEKLFQSNKSKIHKKLKKELGKL